MKNKKPKSLGEIAYESIHNAELGMASWKDAHVVAKEHYNTIAKAVERAVIARLKREGKLSS